MLAQIKKMNNSVFFTINYFIYTITQSVFLCIINYIMKKNLLLLLTITILFSFITPPSEAGIFDATRATISQSREINTKFKAIRNLLAKQNLFCNKKDFEGLSSLYKEDFINNDGFSKDVYFKLIKDTWKSYPDITYTTEIKSINITNNYATVETYEQAIATSKETLGEIEIIGELHGFAHSVYYLEKIGQNWKITSENVIEEKTILSYGDARYLQINLNAPELVGAGKEYTSNLTVEAPYDSVVVASIGKEKITYPQSRSDEVYRKLPENNTLERIFKANSDNTNEYNIASVGITRAEIPDESDPQSIKVYMSGIAFVMSRVNIIPVNKFVKPEVNDEQKDK